MNLLRIIIRKTTDEGDRIHGRWKQFRVKPRDITNGIEAQKNLPAFFTGINVTKSEELLAVSKD